MSIFSFCRATFLTDVRSEFCINVAGFKVRDPLFAETYGTGYSTPTLHVIGRNDVVVIPERSQTLVDVSLNGRLELHDGGTLLHFKFSCSSFLPPKKKRS